MRDGETRGRRERERRQKRDERQERQETRETKKRFRRVDIEGVFFVGFEGGAYPLYRKARKFGFTNKV